MKLKISTYAPLLMLAGLFASCHDDDGNYLYTTLDRVEISVPDDMLASVYDLGEQITINPTVTFNDKAIQNDQDAPLEYVWTLYASGSGLGVDNTVDTLATTRDLVANLTRPGTLTLQLTVTNKSTGIESYFRKSLNVSDAITGGWLLLYERTDHPGYSDIGLVVNPYTRMGELSYKEAWNLYSAINGEPLPGKPVNIFHIFTPLPNGITHVATEQTMKLLSATQFTPIKDISDMFFEPTDGCKISHYTTNTKGSSSTALFIDGTVRLNSVNNMQQGNLGSFSIAKKAEEPVGELANWTAKNCNGGMLLEMVVYSQTNSRFYYNIGNYDSGDRLLRHFAEQDPEAAFDVNNLDGARLLFGDDGGTNEDFMLFAKGDSRFVGIANFTGSTVPSNEFIGTTFTDVSSAPEIANATTFSTGNMSYFAYYSVGNTLYRMSCITGEAHVAWTAPDPDEVITCVKNHKFRYFMAHVAVPENNNIVHIATWNESTQQGKLYQYFINPASFQVMTDRDHQEYKVPGKVKDMSMKFELIFPGK